MVYVGKNNRYTMEELDFAKGTDITYEVATQHWPNYVKLELREGKFIERYSNQIEVDDYTTLNRIRIMLHAILDIPVVNKVRETKLYKFLVKA